MLIRLNLRQAVLGLIALVASLPFQVFAQEPLPSLDGPFLVPEASRSSSPFGDEKSPVDEPLGMPRSDLQTKNTGSLNNLFSHQWVHTTSDRRLKGSVVTLVGQDTLTVSNVNVSLAQQGRVVGRVTSSADGEFVFDGVFPGYYSIVAEADNSFAAFGLAVMSEDSGSHLPGSVEVRVIRPKNDEIRRILNTDTTPTPAIVDDRSVRDPILAKRVFAKSHRVMSTKDGKVLGHISRLGMSPELVDMSQMKAMLLKDGKEIARTDVSKDGSFEFEGVQPGCYGFAAAGNKGVAAVAFCVVKPDSFTQRKSTDGKIFVAALLEETVASALNVELADSADVMSVRETSNEKKPVEGEEVAALEEPPITQPIMPIGGSNMFGAGQIIPPPGSNSLAPFARTFAELAAIGAIAYVVGKELDKNDDTIVSPITTSTIR